LTICLEQKIMTEEIIASSTSQLLNYGVLGVFCLFLIALLVFLWKHLQKREVEHLKRTDKFIEITEKYVANEVLQTSLLADLKELIMRKLK